jgi:hypothetical protein
MIVVALIISVVALVLAIMAYAKALKNKSVTIKEVVKEVKVEHAPIEHPFTYDEKYKCYRLIGSLEVDGSLSCLNNPMEG